MGNHNSALYWAYDTRLGRRWNLDPKPNPNFSSYACFADNPVLHSDPLGDTIKIHAKEGNNNIYAKFYRGKLLNSDGSEYSGSNEYIRTVYSNLVELKSDDNYVNRVLIELEDSDYNHVISSSGYVKAETKPKSDSDKENSIPQGTTIFYDPTDFQTYTGLLDGGPMRIILGHELWHAYDYNEGNNSMKAIDPEGKINVREINAVDFENRLRDANNIPLRNNHSGFTLPIWDPKKPDEPGLKFYNFNAQRGTGSSNSGNRTNDLCPADNVKARNNPIIIKKP